MLFNSMILQEGPMMEKFVMDKIWLGWEDLQWVKIINHPLFNEMTLVAQPLPLLSLIDCL